MNITFEFATQDDCLEKMVPSDLRKIVCERDTLKQQNAELAAQVEAMKNGIHHFNRTRGDLNPLFKAAFDSTPAQCLLEVMAEAGREGWKACVEYIIENTNCKEFSEQDIKTTLYVGLQYANKIRGGE